MTSPAVVRDGLLSMHYGFASVLTLADDEPFTGQDVARAGHRNGLCTAGVPHRLALMTGTHTGDVRFRIEWTDGEPPLADEWEDVVEASVDIASTEGLLAVFENFHELAWPQVGPHRARYCAAGMDLADEPPDEEPGDEIPVEPDRYLLQLWPAPMADDTIVRETSGNARYWHSVAQQTPALSPAELAEALAAEPWHEDFHEDFELHQFDSADIVDDLLQLDGAALRDVAHRLATELAGMAGLSGDERVVAALAAIAAGETLPAPFDDLAGALRAEWNPVVDDEQVQGITMSRPLDHDEPDDGSGFAPRTLGFQLLADGLADDTETAGVVSFAWSSGFVADRNLVLIAVQAVVAAGATDPFSGAMSGFRLFESAAEHCGRNLDELRAWLSDRVRHGNFGATE